MGHDLPNPLGVPQRDLEAAIRRHLPDFMAMGEAGMAEHQAHVDMGHMQGPANTLPMMAGQGPFGPLEMGGMFTVVKIRAGQKPGDYADPGWYAQPAGTRAYEWTGALAEPPRSTNAGRSSMPGATPSPEVEMKARKPGGHAGHH
jgi:hypothetical protein